MTHAARDNPDEELHELRLSLQSLRREVADLRGRLSGHESARGGFARVLLVKGDTNGANWQQQWVGSNNASLTSFVGGMSNSAAFIDPATATGGGTGVATLLQLRNGSNTAFVKIGAAAEEYIDVLIFGTATQDGSNFRWMYGWAEAEKTAAGYGGWTLKAGGRSGPSATWGALYNGFENGHTSDVIQTYGSGLNGANLPGNYRVVKLGTGAYVRARVVRPAAPGALPELWIGAPSTADGNCAA